MRLRILLRGGHKKDCRGRVCLPENTRAAVSTDISVGAFGRANPAPTIIISICVICGEKLSPPSAARGAFPLPPQPAAADLPCAEEGYDYQYQDDDAAIQVVALDAAPSTVLSPKSRIMEQRATTERSGYWVGRSLTSVASGPKK